MVNYLYQEQAGLKQKYETVISLLGEVIETLKKEEMKLLNKNRVKSQRRCRFYNRGFCKEGSVCSFFHPSENCKEFCTSGFCSKRESCLQRHPFQCKYWSKGYCWRKESCLYLHKKEDKPNASKIDEEVSSLNEEDLKNPQNITNHEVSARDAKNDSKDELEESKSVDNVLDCQGCSNHHGQYNCKECHVQFCIDCIVRGNTPSTIFCLNCEEFCNESEDDTIEAIMAKARAFQFEDSDEIESESES